VPGTVALSTVSAKHCIRAASSVGSEKDKLKTSSTTGFVMQKIGLAKGLFLYPFSAGKNIW